MSSPAYAPHPSYPEPHRLPLLLSSSCPRKLYRSASYPVNPPLSLPTEHLARLSNHRESISSSSGSSLCEPTSPTDRRLSIITTDPAGLDSDTDAGAVSSEEPWNLVAYHIPWGPGYEGYDSETGTLPGPDGSCVFLRSPTPLKRQRTSQACEKCRERKAKCSGGRPSCKRCLSRGMLCVYASSIAADAQATSPRTSLPWQSHSGSSALSPQYLKLSTRSRLVRKGSLVDSGIDPGDASHQSSSPSINDVAYRAAFRDDGSTNLDEDLLAFPRLSLPRDLESPEDPLTPFPCISSSNTNPSCKLTAMTRGRPPSSSDDTSTSLYMHPLSALEGYRFPPDHEAPAVPILQPPIAPPGSPIHLHAASVIEPTHDSLFLFNASLSSELDAPWDGTGFFEGSNAFPGHLFPERVLFI